MSMPVICVCELCQRSEHETPLLHYPIHATYKEMMTLMEHREENAVICLECLVKDLAEG